MKGLVIEVMKKHSDHGIVMQVEKLVMIAAARCCEANTRVQCMVTALSA